MNDSRPLLSVENLSVTFQTDHGVVPAVRDLSYTQGRHSPSSANPDRERASVRLH